MFINNKHDLYFVVNVARGKNAYQSSHDSDYGPASNAVDGVTRQRSLKDIIHTETNQPITWWEVDLKNAYFIHDVKIYFRTSSK